MNEFEWDESKRLKNLARHKLNFEDSDLVFNGRPVMTSLSGHLDEVRLVSTVALDDGKFYSVIWTWRGDKRRIISFRRARDGETRKYHQLYG